MYNHTNQLRCDFIRGKSQKEMDDMLPLYAKAVESFCPCAADSFASQFDAEIARLLPSAIGKTLANHRTETAGKLLGLFFEHGGIVYESDRNKKFLQDSDQPALFKDVCFKHQFPTGVQKMSTVVEKLEEGINFRPYPFILSVLQMAEAKSVQLTVKDIGYYILNSADVLKGNASPQEVFDVIRSDKTHRISRTIPLNGKASSFVFQHIREQMNYLELANLIYIGQNGELHLNHYEDAAVAAFVDEVGKGLLFDFSKYDLSNLDSRKQAYSDWCKYYGELSAPALNGTFATNAAAIINKPSETPPVSQPSPAQGQNTVEIGDEGEDVVFQYEKARVKAYNARLINRVLSLGKTKGLGYDIQSVVAISGPTAEFSKYIEVKSTKRVTVPDVNDDSWFDNFTITRNEYLAAQQHKELYSVFRVYFTRGGISFHVIENIPQKAADGKIEIVPLTYRVDFSGKSIDSVISTDAVQEMINA